MIARVLIVAALLGSGAAGVEWLSRPEHHPIRVPLVSLPMQFSGWHGRDAGEFEAKVIEVLGVDDYVNRSYVLDGTPASLYVGYYTSQRTGQTMHSPMKCLPGTGWQPLSTDRPTLAVSDGGVPRDLVVNRYIVQKNTERYVVLFWYQMHGRVIASEYAMKIALVQDAIRYNRTDGALIRVMVPIRSHQTDAEATRHAMSFAVSLFPLLAQHLPA